MSNVGMDRFVELCLCPATSEYDPPCPAHGVLGIGVTGSTPASSSPTVIVFRPDGSEDIGRVVASHVTAADGLHGIGVPKAGAPPAIVEVGGAPILFGPDGWELEGWTRPKPRHLARCLCPEAGASEASS